MPIRADLRQHYGPAWRAICRTRCEAAGWRCEWCGAANDHPPPKTGKRVVLTVAHLNPDPADNRPENLRAVPALPPAPRRGAAPAQPGGEPARATDDTGFVRRRGRQRSGTKPRKRGPPYPLERLTMTWAEIAATVFRSAARL